GDVAFLTHLYQVIYNRRFGGHDAYDLPAVEREKDLAAVRDVLPAVTKELLLDPTGRRLVDTINATLAHPTADVTGHAILGRATADAQLAARLTSREVAEARSSIMTTLQNAWKSYSKFSELVEHTGAVAARSELVGVALKDAHTGLDVASKVAKALDPDSYRK